MYADFVKTNNNYKTNASPKHSGFQIIVNCVQPPVDFIFLLKKNQPQ